ncbi:trypsin-like serine protease [Streptomyces sp. NPDC059629]|uniref:trypsin-like serine protease n=1 Tax=Streptomyces sp. NPDC059629 TaxID=3346889 RepID=UPI003691972B
MERVAVSRDRLRRHGAQYRPRRRTHAEAGRHRQHVTGLKTYDAFVGHSIVPGSVDPAWRLCAVPTADAPSNTCTGDSGSPVLVAHTVWGLVAWGPGCRIDDVGVPVRGPALRTRVEREWPAQSAEDVDGMPFTHRTAPPSGLSRPGTDDEWRPVRTVYRSRGRGGFPGEDLGAGVTCGHGGSRRSARGWGSSAAVPVRPGGTR